MGAAILSALIRKKVFEPSEIGLYDPNRSRMKRLKRLGIRCDPSNWELAAQASVLILAVKPQQMSSVLAEIAPKITKKHLILSIAAGLDSNYFLRRLPKQTRFIRAMPNMAALIGESASGLFAHPNATPADRRLAQKIFSSLGEAVFVKTEEQLDIVTAISGSGPAFVYLFAEAVISIADFLGLPQKLGTVLFTQTLVGAAHMLRRSTIPIREMILAVASKGGTTEAGLKVLADGRFRERIVQTIKAAVTRARELRCIS